MLLRRLIIAGSLLMIFSAAVAQDDLIDDLPQERKEAAKAGAQRTKKPKDERPPLQPQPNTDLIDDLPAERKQAAAKGNAARKSENAIPDNLGDALARALHNSPAISVAEAKVRQTQAELNEVRLSVVQELSLLFQRRASNKADLAIQEATAAKMKEKGYTSQATPPDISKLRQAILEDETRITYLLGVGAEHYSDARLSGVGAQTSGSGGAMMGTMPGMGMGGGGMMGGGRGEMMGGGMMGGGMMGGGMMGGGSAGRGMTMSAGMMGGGTMRGSRMGGMGPGAAATEDKEAFTSEGNQLSRLSEKMRKFLDQRRDMDFADQPLSDVLDYLIQMGDNSANFVMDHDRSIAEQEEQPALTIRLSLKQVTVASALQALADRYELAFIFRDYGILVVTDTGVAGSTIERYRAAGTPMIAPPPFVQAVGVGGLGMGGMMGMPFSPPATTPAPEKAPAE
jgi:hypothetical protein